MRCTRGLAIDAQLRDHKQPIERQRLNDIDIVVESFAAIPESLAQSFLQHHVHPDAICGKTLLQLIDGEHRIRVDLFAAFGTSLTRAHTLNGETGELDVLSVEDLVARTTAFVCGRLRLSHAIDVTRRLAGCAAATNWATLALIRARVDWEDPNA